MNDYDYWFVLPLDFHGNVVQPPEKWILKFKTFSDAMELVNTDTSIPVAVVPGWMWFNIEHACIHCRGTGKEVYPMHRTVIECSFCGGTGKAVQS